MVDEDEVEMHLGVDEAVEEDRLQVRVEVDDALIVEDEGDDDAVDAGPREDEVDQGAVDGIRLEIAPDARLVEEVDSHKDGEELWCVRGERRRGGAGEEGGG